MLYQNYSKDESGGYGKVCVRVCESERVSESE